MGLVRITILTAFLALLANCSTSETVDFGSASDSPGAMTPRSPLQPVGQISLTDDAAIIREFTDAKAAMIMGFRLGDKIISLNKVKVLSAGEFEAKLKAAPSPSTLQIERGSKQLNLIVSLKKGKERLPIAFEPQGISFVRRKSPYIAYMHKSGVTVYSLASLDQRSKELQVSLILDSKKVSPGASLKLDVFKKGQKKPLARGIYTLDSLGLEPLNVKKTLKLSSMDGPYRVSVNLEKKKFDFEFQ